MSAEFDARRLSFRVNILVYEAGAVAKSFVYAAFTHSAMERKAYLDHLATELSDVMLQARVLALELGFSPEELLETSYKRREERRKQYEDAGKGDSFI